MMKKIMENVVVKGTAENIYSPNFSMAGKTGTAKKYIDKKYNSIDQTQKIFNKKIMIVEDNSSNIFIN